MKYRSEIDGLRAIAVAPVVFFHAGLNLFSGGFVGVDVFFVISGYLITTILLDELDSGEFRLLGFYERRARRILPAIIFVSLCCIPAAWMLLIPSDMLDFAQSLMAVATFSSNFLFLAESGYFEGASELKPLLHTWSLAVEEQYYLLFPALLLFLRKHSILFLWTCLIGLFAVSFWFSEWASQNRPHAGFYLIHSRAWELLLGAFVAMYLRRHETELPNWMNNILSCAGLAAISFAILTFDHATPFPGSNALIPSTGTALVILFAKDGTILKSILSTRCLVLLGLISYSLYLWHQPLFAFYRTMTYGVPLDTFHVTSLIAVSVLLAISTYHFIEQPFRNGQIISKRQLSWFCATALSMTFILGTIGTLKSGFPDRYDLQEQELLRLASYEIAFEENDTYSCFIDYDEQYTKLLENKCVSPSQDKPRLILFGDSEAAHLAPGLRTHFSTNYDVMQWTGASCSPVVFSFTSNRCLKFFEAFINRYMATLTDRDIVVIAGNWSNRLASDRNGFSTSVNAALDQYSRYQAQFIIIGDLPNFSVYPPKYIVLNDLVQSPELSLQPIEGSVFGPSNRIIRELAERYAMKIVEPADLFCEDDKAPVCVVYEDDVPTFLDTNHLSAQGSVEVGGKISSSLE